MDLEVFRENIKPVREWLAAGAPRVNIGLYTDVGFNMADFIRETEHDLDAKDHAGNECGTACCIAGYLALLLRRCGDRGQMLRHVVNALCIRLDKLTAQAKEPVDHTDRILSALMHAGSRQ